MLPLGRARERKSALELKIKAEIMDHEAMQRAITRISFEVLEKNKGVTDLCLLGIRRRGVTLSKMIARKIESIEGTAVTLGELDVTYFRDDRNRDEEITKPTLPFSVDGKKVILVDDVMYTGRTVRAAIDAVMSLGRPQLIQLAVLIDRGHRELPIRPDFVGKNVPTSKNESVRVLVSEYDHDNRVVIADI